MQKLMWWAVTLPNFGGWVLVHFIQVISCPLFVYNTQPYTHALDKKLSTFNYMLITRGHPNIIF